VTAKRFRDGSHRVCPPEETWERIAPLLPQAGITRLADVTRLDVVGLPVWQAVRPGSRNLSVSQGKGATPAAARVSAAMESLELWHAEDLGALPAVVMTAAEMAYDNAVSIDALPWVRRQWRELELPLEWVRARSLMRDAEGWLPRAAIELDFTYSPPPVPRLFQLTSSGLASGNCREEALLHALCELLERDAQAAAREEPLRRRPLDPASAACEPEASLVAALRRAGMKVALHALAGRGGVPVVEAEIAAPDLPLAFRGSGCHPAGAVALSRALNEAVQSRLTYISGARDDVQLDTFASSTRFAWSELVETAGGESVAALADLSTDTVAGDLAALVARCDAEGLEPFAVDLERPEIGVPVARVFVPGLRDLYHHA